jgi:glutamate 5-kinase
VAAKIDADLLVILSNVDGLYDKNPAKYPDAKLIDHVADVTTEIEGFAEDTATETSIGGMRTKLEAAKIACASGLPVVIASGRHENVVSRILAGDVESTVFGPADNAMTHRKRWIAFGRSTKGKIKIDEGAGRALTENGRSLLAAGITGVEGSFEVGEAVDIQDAKGRTIARGLSNYGCTDLRRIQGLKSNQIRETLGRKDFDEVVHRDNLVIL